MEDNETLDNGSQDIHETLLLNSQPTPIKSTAPNDLKKISTLEIILNDGFAPNTLVMEHTYDSRPVSIGA